MIIKNSSTIAEINYDFDDKKLFVTFKDKEGDSKDIYCYKDVPEEEAKSFMTSDSVGKYLHAHIKPKYECKKIVLVVGSPTPPEPEEIDEIEIKPNNMPLTQTYYFGIYKFGGTWHKAGLIMHTVRQSAIDELNCFETTDDKKICLIVLPI